MTAPGRVHVEAAPPIVGIDLTLRCVWAHCVPWRTPTRVTASGSGQPIYEWFQPGSLRLPPGGSALWLRHQSDGGKRVGTILRLIDRKWGLDAVALIDEGPRGDGLLELIHEHDGQVPVSVGYKLFNFPGARTLHPDDPVKGTLGVSVNRAWLTEVAIVAAAAYEGATTYDITGFASVTHLGVSK